MSAFVSAQDVERFKRFITGHFGFSLEDQKLFTLGDLLRRHASASRLSCTEYLDRLGTLRGEADVRALAVDLTIPETHFYRASAQLRAFRDVALPASMKERAASRQLRILSAGCASGEEPYSLAMIVREMGIDATWQVLITGVDVNTKMLEKARRARFTAWSLRETPAEWQQRWFRVEGTERVVDDSVRALVAFEERNLVSAREATWPEGTFDVVFWRNVMMYFTRDHAAAILGRLTRALVPNGYLFLGHAETLRGLSNDYRLCHTHETFYYQRAEEPVVERPAPLPFVPSSLPTPRVESEPLVEAARAAPRLDAVFELLEKERFHDALASLAELPEAALHDAQVQLVRAALLTHAGELAAAEQACAALLEIDELDAGAHYLLALCREGAGDRRAATEHHQIAAYLDPAFAMPRLHLGLLSRRGNEREAARRELGQALLLLQHEDSSRLRLFGGGFARDALIALCRSELAACGGAS